MTKEWTAIRQSARILVIDDGAALRADIRRSLEESWMKAQVDEAENGAAGLRMVLENDYDCVVCDLEMPIMDGMGFLRMVRQHKNRFELPVLLLTAADREATQLAAFRAGTSDFVTKPLQGALLVARVGTHVKLAHMHRELMRIAEVDALTGLRNRRKFMQELQVEFLRARRLQNPLAFGLVDVDFFKNVNDTYGHPKGDDVLRALAKLLRDRHRVYDGAGRLGGEEFGLVLPETSLEGARVVCDRFRQEVEETELAGLKRGEVTVSLGLTMLRTDDDSPDALYSRADRELYRAKESGRNRVCYTPPGAGSERRSKSKPDVKQRPASGGYTRSKRDRSGPYSTK